MTAPRILFACLGHICRSPAAEGVFRALAPHAPVDSAGASDWHPGDPPHGPMQAAARARGIDLSGPRARQFAAEDFQRVDLIAAMDDSNLARIEALRPEGCETRAYLFTEFAPETGAAEVPDPCYTRDFDGAPDLIETCAKSLAAHLAGSP